MRGEALVPRGASLRLDVSRGLVLADELAEGARRLDAALKRFFPDLDEEQATVEFLVHEVIHAFSLGRAPSPTMWQETRDALRAMKTDPCCAEETRVLACEYLFFAQVRVPITYDDIFNAAHYHSVEDDLDEALSAPETHEVLRKTMTWAKSVGLVVEG